MSIGGIQPGQSYQVHDLKPGVKNDKVTKAGENDGLVNIVVNAPKLDGGAPELRQVITGEKIDLEELGKANPDLAIDELRAYDRNEDGILEESDLTKNFWDVAMESPWINAMTGIGGAIGHATYVAAQGGVIGVEYRSPEHQSPSGQVISLR